MVRRTRRGQRPKSELQVTSFEELTPVGEATFDVGLVTREPFFYPIKGRLVDQAVARELVGASIQGQRGLFMGSFEPSRQVRTFLFGGEQPARLVDIASRLAFTFNQQSVALTVRPPGGRLVGGFIGPGGQPIRGFDRLAEFFQTREPRRRRPLFGER